LNKLTIAAAGVIASLACVGPLQAAENWRAWNIHNDGHPNTAAMDRFSELVNEATGGEVTVEVFHGGVLGSQPDALEQVRLGAIELGDAGARSFYSQKPINTPADVEGLKIRVMNNDLYTSMISAMGGNPSPMAFAEVQQALKTGVVDGAENNFPSFQSVGHYEVTTHYSMSEHLIIPECICVNTAKFDALSPELQEAVTGAAQEAALFQRVKMAQTTE